MVSPSPSTFDSAEDDGLRAPARYRLVVVEGNDRGLLYVLDATRPSRTLVGTGEACDLRIHDSEVSRRHLAVDVAAGGLRATDLDSTNGSFVGAVRVFDMLLRGGEQVRIGTTVISVERDETNDAAPLSTAEYFGSVVGRSVAMRRIYPLCRRLAAADVPVIVEGETGTGKEVLAEAIHAEGPRGDKPFVVFDCTAVATSLLESELFGHERGAFTGAIAARKGVFEEADGGTLLIDEIGELDPTLQPKLLRALERQEIRRVGGDRWTKVDVRIIAATRRDLDREVELGRFRDDLYHRLVVGRLELPPLRTRHGDVELLARHFWSDLGGDPAKLDPATLARWDADPWPGNVRELRNAVARHLALGNSSTPRKRAPLPPGSSTQDFLDRLVASRVPFTSARDEVLAEFEQRYVTRALADHGGDVTRAASASGIGKRYFQLIRARRGGGG